MIYRASKQKWITSKPQILSFPSALGTKAQLEETQAKSPGVDHWELGWIMLKSKTPLDDDIWDYSQPLMDIKRNVPKCIYISIYVGYVGL